MSTKVLTSAPAISDAGRRTGSVFSALRSLISQTRWMQPIETYALRNGAEFGRGIEKELKALSSADSPGVVAVALRKKMSAVVITPEHYQEMVDMRARFQELVAAQAKATVEEAQDDFDALYTRITSRESRGAADRLFSASGDELAASYQPGATETAQ